MYVSVIGSEPMAFLVWTPRGAIEILARITAGQFIVGLLLVVAVAVQLWAWWSDRLDGWLDG